MTPLIIRETIKWIIDHLDNIESIKTMLKHVFLPIKLTEHQVEELINKVKVARENEIELKRIGEELALISEENFKQMYI